MPQMPQSMGAAPPARPAGPSREQFADRLLRGSVRKSYAPVVDLDWDAPLDPDLFFLPPHMVSLFGTPLWDTLSRAQQVELSRQELVNTLSVGIWFENILNQALLRDLINADPTDRAAHYALTEMGDETRHMVMFGMAIAKLGARPMRPRRWQRVVINLLPLTFRGPVLWLAALIGEEIFDALQRQMLDDPQLQPLVSRLMRVHVTEEARHIQFARDGIRTELATMTRRQKWWLGNLHALGAVFFAHLMANPAQYRRAGIDPALGSRTARASAHRRAVLTSGFAPLAGFLTDTGLMGRWARRTWARHGFLQPANHPPVVAVRPAPQVFDGPVGVGVDGVEHRVRARITGRLDPIDGRYHWRGVLYGPLEPQPAVPAEVTLAIGQSRSAARITERLDWGHTVTGSGACPFA